MSITNICSTTTWTHRNFRHRIITTMAFFTCCHFRRSHLFIFLVQLHKLKVILVAACLLIVEGVDAHVCLLQFLGSIVEWVGGVLQSRHGHNHIWCEDGAIGALNTFRLHLKNPTHSNSSFRLYYKCRLHGITCQRAKLW